MGKRGYRTIEVPVRNEQIAVHTSARVADALGEVLKGKTLYEGVRLWQVMEAVYRQGQKDGARAVFTQFDDKLDEVKHAIPHRKPGRPRNRR